MHFSGVAGPKTVKFGPKTRKIQFFGILFTLLDVDDPVSGLLLSVDGWI